MTQHSEHEHGEHEHSKQEQDEDEHGNEPIEELAEEAVEDNPDDQTRRETFELDLMEEGRSDEGTAVDLDEEDQHDDTK
jgi:hypothetical protein